MRARISIRGYVRPSVRRSVRPSVRLSFAHLSKPRNFNISEQIRHRGGRLGSYASSNLYKMVYWSVSQSFN